MRYLSPVACLMAGLALADCATNEQVFHWTRVDGKPIVAQQYEVDSTICRGDTQKTNYVGCMAERGYLRRPDQPR
jgi:hypothetical protein